MPSQHPKTPTPEHPHTPAPENLPIGVVGLGLMGCSIATCFLIGAIRLWQ